MLVGTVREIKDNENRVGLTPAGAGELVGDGHQVLCEAGAGSGSGFADEAYLRAGARLCETAAEVWGEAEMVVKVKEPLADEYHFLRPGLILFTYLHLAPLPVLTGELLDRGVSAIAYETVELSDRRLPLLVPMSEVAGRLSVQAGMRFLERPQGGRGVLLAGVPGVERGRVVVIGSGVVGSNAALLASAVGAGVTVLGRNHQSLGHIEEASGGQIVTRTINNEVLCEELAAADLVIGAVLSVGARAPVLVSREMVSGMRSGAVIVDVAIDQGGCVETSRPTSHSAPVFIEEGVVHYCVTNMPGAVPRTSTLALTSATLPYVRAIAERGLDALRDDPALARGLNCLAGSLTNQAVAEEQGRSFVPPAEVLA